MKAEARTSGGVLPDRIGGGRRRGREWRPGDLYPPESASFSFSETFQVARVRAEAFWSTAHAANQPGGLRQFVSGTGAALLAQVILQCNPHEVGGGLSVDPGGFANASSQS